MAFFLCYHYLLLLVLHHIVLITASCIEAPEGIFKTQPTNQMVREGEDASFTCSVSDFNQNVDSVTWEVVRDVNHKVVTETFDRSRLILESTIVVHNVLDENQFFQCKLRRSASEGPTANRGDVCYLPNRARTIVQNFPTEGEVTCDPNDPSPFEIGDVIAISCSAPRSKPAVDMGFVLDEPSHVSIPHPVVTEDGPIRTITKVLTATSDLHLRTVNCKVTSEMSFPGRTILCPIGPIKVYQPPSVTVEPPESTLQRTDELITLSCHAVGFPDVFTYSWSCFPFGYLEGCDVRRKEVSLTFNCSMTVHPSPVEVVIYCSAMNSKGASSNMSRILIPGSLENECKHTTTVESTLKPNSFGGNLILFQRYAKYVGNHDWEILVECRFTSLTEEGHVYPGGLNVYFDNKPIGPDHLQTRNGSVNTCIFGISHVYSSNSSLTVTCKANTTFGMIEKTIDLFLDLPLMTVASYTIGRVTDPTQISRTETLARYPTTSRGSRTGDSRAIIDDVNTKYPPMMITKNDSSVRSMDSYTHVPKFIKNILETELAVSIVIVGVVLDVCIIPCVVAGIYITLYRYFSVGSKGTSGSSIFDQNDDLDQVQKFDLEVITIEPPYEMPEPTSTFFETEERLDITHQDFLGQENCSSYSDTWSSHSSSSCAVSGQDSSSC